MRTAGDRHVRESPAPSPHLAGVQSEVAIIAVAAVASVNPGIAPPLTPLPSVGPSTPSSSSPFPTPNPVGTWPTWSTPPPSRGDCPTPLATQTGEIIPCDPCSPVTPLHWPILITELMAQL